MERPQGTAETQTAIARRPACGATPSTCLQGAPGPAASPKTGRQRAAAHAAGGKALQWPRALHTPPPHPRYISDLPTHCHSPPCSSHRSPCCSLNTHSAWAFALTVPSWLLFPAPRMAPPHLLQAFTPMSSSIKTLCPQPGFTLSSSALCYLICYRFTLGLPDQTITPWAEGVSVMSLRTLACPAHSRCVLTSCWVKG